MEKAQLSDERMKLREVPVPDFNRELLEAQKDKIIDSFFIPEEETGPKHPLNELLERSFENQMRIMETLNRALETFNSADDLINNNKIYESEIETEMIKAKIIANNKLEAELSNIGDCSSIFPNCT